MMTLKAFKFETSLLHRILPHVNVKEMNKGWPKYALALNIWRGRHSI
jgi:hypothetical protein